MNLLSDCEVLPCKASKPTAACIFLHGTGETGLEAKEHFKKLFRNSGHRYMTFYFPTASKGYLKIRDTSKQFESFIKETTFWFNAERYGPENEDVDGDINDGDKVVTMLENMVSELEASGLPRSRIVIGGSSQGGMVSILAVYSRNLQVAAVATVASTLVFRRNSNLIKDSKIPLLSLYGQQDAFITMRNMSRCWGVFKDHHIPFTPRVLAKCAHNLSVEYLKTLMEWVEQKVPM